MGTYAGVILEPGGGVDGGYFQSVTVWLPYRTTGHFGGFLVDTDEGEDMSRC